LTSSQDGPLNSIKDSAQNNDDAARISALHRAIIIIIVALLSLSPSASDEPSRVVNKVFESKGNFDFHQAEPARVILPMV
jgi:hypothetical protein